MHMAPVRTAIPKLWRIAAKVILWTLVIGVALVLVVVAINAFDEDLSPEAKRLLAAPPNPWTPEQNLYIALTGFDALPGESQTAVGQTRVVKHDELHEAFWKDPQTWLERAGDLKASQLKFVGKVDFCLPRTNSCWTGVENHKDEIDALLKANQALYQRYLDLPRLPGYYETAVPNFLPEPAYVPGPVRRLFLLNVALRIKTARSTQQEVAAFGDLYNDLSTWRRMFIGEGPLLSKTIALAYLKEDYALLGDLIADPTIDTEAVDHEIDAILGLFDPNDWKLRDIYAYEFRMWNPVLDPDWRPPFPRTEPDPLWKPYNSRRIEGYFMKSGATANLSARSYIELQKVADSDAKDLLAARDAYLRWTEEYFEPGVRNVYNPVGRTLVGFHARNLYNDYPLLAYDVAAFVRLVRLGYAIRQQKLATEDVGPFIEEHPQWASHPVNGQPFAWDANKRVMAMQPLAWGANERVMGIERLTPKESRFSIPIGTADSAH